MINVECRHCRGRNKVDESAYQPGSHIVISCMRCGEDIEVDIPGTPVVSSNVDQDDSIHSTAVTAVRVDGNSGEEISTVSHAVPATDVELEKARMVLEAEKIKLEHRRMDHEEKMRQTEMAQTSQYYPPTTPEWDGKPLKNKTTAALLAIFLGGIGAHKFYLGKTGMGIMYLLFCWTYIPGIMGLLEGIIYLTKNDAEFHSSY